MSQESILGIGSSDDPLIDLEMGQELFVWRERSEILIVQGDPDAEPGNFRVAIRVPEERLRR